MTLADQTGAAEPCIATQIASASTTCEDVASTYGIQLSSSVTSSLFSSEACKSALEAYRICVQMDDTTAQATSGSSVSSTAASNSSTASTGTTSAATTSSTTLPATDLTTSSSTTPTTANSTTSSSSTGTAADLNTSSSTTRAAANSTTSSSSTGTAADPTTSSSTTGTAADLTTSSSTTGTAADLTTSSSTTVTAADQTTSSSASDTSSETTPASKALTAAESDVTTTSTLTTTRLTTLTFTQGLGASATVKTITLTRVETDFETELVDVQAGTTSGLARSTQSTAGVATTAPAQVTPDTTSAARVTMFSVSAEAITETKTMTNSYVSDDVTHIEEVIAVQVSTEYITIFTTLTETDVIDPPSSTPMPTLSQAVDDPLVTSDYLTTETELFTHIVTEVDTELKTTMLVTLVHGKNAGVSTTSSVSSSEPSSSTTALLSVTSLPASMSLPTSTSLPSATSPFANATTAAACSSSSAPAPTQTGIVSGCTQWHVAQTGDSCAVLAQKYNIALSTFLDWNRAINNITCADMMAGDAYCVGTCSNPSLAANSTSNSNSTSSASTTLEGTSTTSSTSLPTTTPSGNLSATDVYKTYTGDGSLAAGWPSMSQWVTFDTMFTQNTPNMLASCAQWGVPNNTPTEQANLRSAILSLANTTNVDPRFILAIIMQESTGCVRVITTEYSVPNPGLMQSHNGTGTCNTNHAFLGLIPNVIGVVQDPCPDTQIEQMIHDGVAGTASGDGLVQLLAEQGHTDVSKWYRTARMYNGGSIAASGDLGQGCCTACYASDVANRLTGWVNAPHTCQLTLTPA